jgi:hypothetical protein
MRRSFQGPAGESRAGSPARGCAGRAMRRMRAPGWIIPGVLVLVAVGCSGGGKGGGPRISPRDAASAAMAAYDTNKDGALDAKELESCPALQSALKRIDKNNDGRLSAEEITDRLTFLRSQEAQSGVSVEVTFDGRPLSGATVTLVPEKFMGASFKPLSVVTDEAGSGIVTLEGGSDLAPLGYYRVEVSKKNTKGQESIPARYNTKTVLGYEISPDVEGRGSSANVSLRLTSR